MHNVYGGYDGTEEVGEGDYTGRKKAHLGVDWPGESDTKRLQYYKGEHHHAGLISLVTRSLFLYSAVPLGWQSKQAFQEWLLLYAAVPLGWQSRQAFQEWGIFLTLGCFCPPPPLSCSS